MDAREICRTKSKMGNVQKKNKLFIRKYWVCFYDRIFRMICSKLIFVYSRVSDKIPLQKEVSYESIDQSAEDVISLKIISYDGRFVNLRSLATTTIEEVKWQAITELVLPINREHGTSVPDYRLLRPSETMLDLDESLSISQNKLSDYGKRNGFEIFIRIEFFMEFLQMNFC